ncbi:hypothetical protein [Noviherbaspirillum sp. Root189]|uniref:hypothetical protein n=1 Tax=Noviherbaspirillum sp. Root189 TaxID=1736487 RepID=UPI00070B0EAB|nr:hypothetical protein [Noviherbaspirillum sp. Root189]
MVDVWRQWEDLCVEFEAAKMVELRARIPVHRKFATLSDQGQARNPTRGEIDEWQSALSYLDDVKARLASVCSIPFLIARSLCGRT